MNARDVIAKKRDGGELSRAEIEFFVQGYARGEIADYQAAAWLMAVYLRGMTNQETHDLTLAMAHSGDTLDLKDIVPFSVDILLPIALKGRPIFRSNDDHFRFLGYKL